MSLEKLSGQIALDTKTETNRILEEARDKTKHIIGEAEKKKKQGLSEAENNALKTALAEKTGEIAAAKLEAKRIIEEAKEEKTGEVLAEIRNSFLRQREAKNYPSILEALIKAGLGALGENAVVMVNEKDQAIARQFAKKARVKKAGIAAGAIVASADEKIIVDDSFEAVFREKTDAIKAVLFQKMFAQVGEK